MGVNESVAEVDVGCTVDTQSPPLRHSEAYPQQPSPRLEAQRYWLVAVHLRWQQVVDAVAEPDSETVVVHKNSSLWVQGFGGSRWLQLEPMGQHLDTPSALM
jgi:hypothetical protein